MQPCKPEDSRRFWFRDTLHFGRRFRFRDTLHFGTGMVPASIALLDDPQTWGTLFGAEIVGVPLLQDGQPARGDPREVFLTTTASFPAAAGYTDALSLGPSEGDRTQAAADRVAADGKRGAPSARSPDDQGEQRFARDPERAAGATRAGGRGT